MNSQPTKTCPFCAETIRVDAKVCPRCRQWQVLWSLKNPVVFILTFTFLISLLGIAFLVWCHRIIEPGSDFTFFRDSIAVIDETKLVFYERDKEVRLRTIVVLTNRSEVSWKNLELEARFFDKDRKLIDARTYTTGDVILEHGELAIPIETSPCRPQSDYVFHQVFVRAAKSAQSFP